MSTLRFSEKVIILLSAGSSSDSLSIISQTIAEGRQLVAQVEVVAFGLNVHGMCAFSGIISRCCVLG